MFGTMVSYLKRRHSEFEWTKATQQLTFSAIGVADSGFFPLDNSSMNIANTDTPSLSLHDVDGLRVRTWQYVIRDTLCSENLFVNQIFLGMRRSWTEVLLYYKRIATLFQKLQLPVQV